MTITPTQTLSTHILDEMMTRPQVRPAIASIFVRLQCNAIHHEPSDWDGIIKNVSDHCQWSASFLGQVASRVYMLERAANPMRPRVDTFTDILSAFDADELCDASEMMIDDR